MSTEVDPLPQGAPYAIGAVFFAALETAPALAGAMFRNNPVRASDLADGDRVIFYEDVSDGPLQQDEQVLRVYRYNVGVINRTEGDAARLGAHADYRVCKRVLREALPLLKDIVTVKFNREGEAVFRLENIDVGGGLVLATFTVGYRDPGFAGVARL